MLQKTSLTKLKTAKVNRATLVGALNINLDTTIKTAIDTAKTELSTENMAITQRGINEMEAYLSDAQAEKDIRDRLAGLGFKD